MTQSGPPIEVNYQSRYEGGNAPLLVRLAAIFNAITAGLDLLAGGMQLVSLALVLMMMRG